jgi:hypothetical protein
MGGTAHRQAHQLLVLGGQLGEGLQDGAQRGVVADALLGGRSGGLRPVVGDRLRALAGVAPDDAERLVARRGRQPGRQPVGLADPRAVLGEAQPHRLHDVLGAGRAQAVRAGDRPHEPGIPVDDLAPGLLVTCDDAAQELLRLHDPGV